MTNIQSLSSTDDSSIVNRLRRGEDQALNEVYRKCRDYCIKFLVNNGADTEKAADLFQDAIIVFYEKVKNQDFELRSSVQTYLNSICRNQWLTHLRDNKEVFVKDPETLSMSTTSLTGLMNTKMSGKIELRKSKLLSNKWNLMAVTVKNC